MIHPASRLSVVVHSRADGRSAIKSASYTSRTSFFDERLGRRFRPSKLGGLLSHELINWGGEAEQLWNAAEAAENRGNARVIRELRPSLPAELPLADQIRLVRGFCLWLRDRYGVAVQADIHAPRFLDARREKEHMRGRISVDDPDYVAALFDAEQTNRNFHAHLLMTTREVCADSGEFGAKTRMLDDRKRGPEEILAIRAEWEKRTNSALERAGSDARVDLRSYEKMAADGDAPMGLKAQQHLGPKRSARARRIETERRKSRVSKAGDRVVAQTKVSKDGDEIAAVNEMLWASWEHLKKLEIQKRLDAAEIAQKREMARKQKAEAEKLRLCRAESAEEAELALEKATQFDSLKLGPELAAALKAAAAQEADRSPVDDEFSTEVDLDTYQPPPQPAPKTVVTVGQPRVEWVKAPDQLYR